MKTRIPAAAISPIFGALSLLALGCGGGAPPAAEKADPAAVVARYQGGEIRRGDIQQAIDSNLAKMAQPATPEVRRQLVRKIVERRVRTQMLYVEAQAKGYAERPEVKFRQAAFEDRALAEALLERETAAAKAADAVVVAEVDRRLAASAAEETRKFSHIYLRAAEADAAARQAATAKMAEIQQELAGGAGFNQLAEKYSTSVMARGGGRIEWTSRRKLQAAAGAAVFALEKEGDVSPVVETADGLHLFRLDGIRLPALTDAAGIRTAVRQELDAEARGAAVRARRQQALDAAAAEFAPAGRLAELADAKFGELDAAAGRRWVARWQAGGQAAELSADELLALRGFGQLTGLPIEAELRLLVENRLLAAAERERGAAELAEEIAEARRLALIDSYRGDLMEALDSPSSEEEIARFYRENSSGAEFLRDFEVDLLFFPQRGESVAEAYASGEEVVAKLRQGAGFDDLLARPGRPEAQTCRQAHLDAEEIGKSSIRLRKALVNLTEGEVSAALYIERPLAVGKGCSFDGPGVAFVRLRRLGTLPLEQARPAILATLSKARVDQGIDEIQKRLIAESKLEILLPEG
jgi:parvulin-like peptidyl-prolyl isomerase